MKRTMMTLASLLLVAACGAGQSDEGATSSMGQAAYDAEILVDWNERVLAAAEAEDGFLTLKGLRTATMMHLAVHDALNAIEGRYESYRPATAARGANPLAAVAAAALEVAVAAYPDRRQDFAGVRDRWLEAAGSEAGRAAGVTLGEATAAAVAAARADDGWDNEAQYQWHPMGPGVYAEFAEHSGTPEGFVFGAGWATADPFTLESPSQFRSPPPPAIDGDEYARAFDEVKEVGRFDSPTRTPDQAHLAMWWKDFAEHSHNRLARRLVIEEEVELWRAARLFALLNMAIYDAYVNVFDNKFLYNHWRPYTAIRWQPGDRARPGVE